MLTAELTRLTNGLILAANEHLAVHTKLADLLGQRVPSAQDIVDNLDAGGPRDRAAMLAAFREEATAAAGAWLKLAQAPDTDIATALEWLSDAAIAHRRASEDYAAAYNGQGPE